MFLPPQPSEAGNTASKPATSNTYADIAKNDAQQRQRNATAAQYIGHLLTKGNELNLADKRGQENLKVTYTVRKSSLSSRMDQLRHMLPKDMGQPHQISITY